MEAVEEYWFTMALTTMEKKGSTVGLFQHRDLNHKSGF